MDKIKIFIISILTVIFFNIPKNLFSEELSILCVSLEQYEQKRDVLDYVSNDLNELVDVFGERFGAQCILCKDSDIDINGTGSDRHKKSIVNKIEQWSRRCDINTMAILYLAGHGILGPDGKLYFPMINFNEKDFENTTISVEWIRKCLLECNSKNKLLILDACHSGTGRGISNNLLSVSQVADGFNESLSKDITTEAGFVTLASSRGDEQSWLWKEKQHSLFTFWLLEGLKGNADYDSNNVVELSELIEYLKLNVPVSSKIAVNKEQNPTFYNEDLGKNIAFSLRPISRNDCIEDLENLIDTEMQLCKINEICIPEFTSSLYKDSEQESKEGEVNLKGFGLLTRDFPAKLIDKLNMRRNYNVMGEEQTRQYLKGVDLKDYGTEKTRLLKLPNGDPMPAILKGHISTLNESGSIFRCECKISYGKKTTHKLVGIFMTKEHVIKEKDKNGDVVKTEPDFETIGMSGVSFMRTFADKEEAPSETTPHPLSPDFDLPYKFWIEARKANSNDQYEKRALHFNGNHCSVTLKKGEEYGIFIHNNSQKELFFAVLVDGLNSLSQFMPSKPNGYYIDKNDNKEEVFAPRVSLNQARTWVQAPQTKGSVLGFYYPKDKKENKYQAELRRFTVVDANQALVKRSYITEQIGIITIVLFEAVPPSEGSSRGTIATDGGKPENISVNAYKGKNVRGRLMGVLNIHYQEEE